MLSLRAFSVQMGRGVAKPSESLPTFSTPNRSEQPQTPIQSQFRGNTEEWRPEALGKASHGYLASRMADGWMAASPTVIRREVEPRSGKQDLLNFKVRKHLEAQLCESYFYLDLSQKAN